MFFIIWGFRVLGRKLSGGTFFCPRCQGDRPYERKAMRRWFTLFWIPVFPVGKILGEQVTCQSCHAAFRPQVLNTPTSAALSDSIRDAARVAAVCMVRASAATGPATRAAAVAMISEAGGQGYDDAALSNDLAAIDPSTLPPHLTPLATGLALQGKEHFTGRLATIGLADGTLDAGEHAVLQTVAAGLQLTPTHLAGIVATAQQAPDRMRGPVTGEAHGPHPGELPGGHPGQS